MLKNKMMGSSIVGFACTSSLLLALVLLAPLTEAWFSKSASSQASDSEAVERCFCQLKGLIDDCSCSVESIDSFNNVQVYPVLNSLLGRDFFRYWKVNLQKHCPFWPDDSRCALRYCSVEQCEVPPGIKGGEWRTEAVVEEDCTGEEHLGFLNTTISDESRAGFEVWAAHDSALDDSFCEPEDDSSPGSAYVDLLANPERYTGYQGPSAHRVWSSIYRENCFSPSGGGLIGSPTGGGSPFSQLTEATVTRDALSSSHHLQGMCLEKRTFYRAISGLHASINVHLAAQYLLSDESLSAESSAVWGYNTDEFRKRFDPEMSEGEGPTRLKNLYFLYLMELRALAKAGPQLELMPFFTGDAEEDADVRSAVKRLVKVARSFQHFDESTYFSNGAASLKEEFRLHFRNVTRIMDCVGCDKCKLWGKLQVTGLGTALKILFSGDFEDDFAEKQKSKLEADLRDVKPPAPPSLNITRNEVVALVNAIGRLSRSIYELEQFRKLMKR